MSDITAREAILKKIRQALSKPATPRFPNVDWEKPVYQAGSDTLAEQFAVAFTKVGGNFVYCESELEFLENVITLAEENGWKHFYCYEKEIAERMDEADFPYTIEKEKYPDGMVSITSCEALVARLGNILVSSRQGSGRKLFVAPAVHIILAYSSQIHPELKDALKAIKDKYGEQMPSMIASLAGPSRTADIEKTLVSPAHGPKSIFVFLIDR